MSSSELHGKQIIHYIFTIPTKNTEWKSNGHLESESYILLEKEKHPQEQVIN